MVEGLAQLQFQAPARLDARIHARLEEPVGPASVALGAIQGKVRIVQQLVEIRAIPWRECNTD
jgi:hypothetical protein